jgi:Methylase involved in ubiquinone/menaquinone biosynthesis
MLTRLLALPDVADLNVDSDDRIIRHSAVLARKPMLREVFTEFHHLFRTLDERYFGKTDGLRVEIGAGVAPVRDSYPDVLATDVVAASHLDRTLDAQAMDLPDSSVRALYGQNCFHHFPQPDRFFSEVERVVAPGGGVILIEPYHGPVASLLYKRLFASEGFDKTMPGWEAPSDGPMNGANQALSHIVFVRDRATFEARFPDLEIVHAEPLGNLMRYLLSGGLNFRQLVPDIGIPAIKAMEWLVRPILPLLALHHVIVLRHRWDR